MQTDNTDQPDINVAAGGAGLHRQRVLAMHLETVAQIHRDYGGMSVAELRKVEVELLDFILRWGIDYLVASCDRDLSAMLQAAMNGAIRPAPTRVSSPAGGLHLQQLPHEDNGCRRIAAGSPARTDQPRSLCRCCAT